MRGRADMPTLTRRRSTDAREECWHVYYGDVHAGTIAIRTGNPHDEDPWEWHCGFYPGSHPRECTQGTAATFEQARTEFESAWRIFLAKRDRGGFPDVARSTGVDSRKISLLRSRRAYAARLAG